MKKIILLLFTIVFLVALVGCNQNINENEESKTDEVFALVVVEDVTDTTILGTISETDIKVSIPNWFVGTVTIEPKTFLTISYDGNILETYPSQFSKINYMEYLSPTGKIFRRTNKDVVNNETTTNPDESVSSEILYNIFVEKYDGEIPIKKKLLNKDALIIVENTTDMADGTEFICNCPPDYTITINNKTYMYHSKSGLLIDESYGVFVVKDKETVNNILNSYLGGIYNGK